MINTANYHLKQPGMAAIGAQKRAQYAMGCIYLTGDFGTKKDIAKGLAFLCRAAYRGEPDAQFKLALCFLRGIGVAPDTELAMGWLKWRLNEGCHTLAEHDEDSAKMSDLLRTGKQILRCARGVCVK